MRGRKPKPTHLKLVTGNPGKRKLNRREPKPRRLIPSAPEHLSPDARIVWGQLSAKLDRLGVLTELDGLALEQACEAAADVKELGADIRKHGRTTKLKRAGKIIVRARPQVKMYEEANRRLRAWMTEFGLTPSSRTRLDVEPPKGKGDEDPTEAYFR